jgi:hypothetical protein
VEQAEGIVEEISGKEDLHEAIWDNIHLKRFYLAKEAPMFSGPLRGIFGYNSATPTANAILEGKYQYPFKFDEATKEILQECAIIHLQVPINSISTTITPDDWSNHWHRAREETSSFISGRHFGHYPLQDRPAITICDLPPSPLITLMGNAECLVCKATYFIYVFVISCVRSAIV